MSSNLIQYVIRTPVFTELALRIRIPTNAIVYQERLGETVSKVNLQNYKTHVLENDCLRSEIKKNSTKSSKLYLYNPMFDN